VRASARSISSRIGTDFCFWQILLKKSLVARDREFMPILRRREFITLVGGAAAPWPRMAQAQQAAMPVVGFLHNQSLEAYRPFVAAFRQGLRQSGVVEGQNVSIEYRWGYNDSSRLPILAAELVRLPVAVLVAGGGDPAIFAAKVRQERSRWS
jgi:putative ABC transport system substrate-binding protein